MCFATLAGEMPCLFFFATRRVVSSCPDPPGDCSSNGGVGAGEIGGSCPQSAAITPKAHDSGCRAANCNRAQQVMAIDDSLNSRMHRPSPVYRPVRVPQDLSAL